MRPKDVVIVFLTTEYQAWKLQRKTIAVILEFTKLRYLITEAKIPWDTPKSAAKWTIISPLQIARTFVRHIIILFSSCMQNIITTVCSH